MAALKPGGRVVFVEYRKEDPSVPIKELHKMAASPSRPQMTAGRPRPHPDEIETLPDAAIATLRWRDDLKGIGCL